MVVVDVDAADVPEATEAVEFTDAVPNARPLALALAMVVVGLMCEGPKCWAEWIASNTSVTALGPGHRSSGPAPVEGWTVGVEVA